MCIYCGDYCTCGLKMVYFDEDFVDDEDYQEGDFLDYRYYYDDYDNEYICVNGKLIEMD